MRIGFLDDDHVMKLMRLLLSADGPDDEHWLRSFFVPEAVDLEALFARGAGLRRRDGVTVGLGTRDVDVLVFRRGRVTAPIMAASPRLRLVQRLGEDVEGIDVAAARARGIAISCLPRRTLRHTAEHAMLLMLALTKRLLAADRAVRSGHGAGQRQDDAARGAYNWAGLDGIGSLDGRTLGIVGLGEVGALVARRGAAFGMNVLYASRTRRSPRREAELGVTHRSLEALLEEADVVSLHVPATAANAALIGAPELARMRADALLINTSRGALVDEDALHAALVEGRLGGAGLDVHDPEPRRPDDRFCRLDNVVLTPHVAGGPRTAVLDEIEQMYDNIRAVLARGPLPHGRV